MHNFYKEYGLTIIKINYNKEFKPALDTWCIKQEPIIKANHTNSSNHIPQAKRNNHTIQKRARVACY